MTPFPVQITDWQKLYSSLDTRPENRTLLSDTTLLSQMSEYPQRRAQPAKHFEIYIGGLRGLFYSFMHGD